MRVLCLMGIAGWVACSDPGEIDGVVANDEVATPTVDADDTAGPASSALAFEMVDRMMLTEPLSDCRHATVVDDFLHICHAEDGTWLRDERNGAATWLGEFEWSAAAIHATGDVVLALDGALFVHDESGLIPLAIPVPVPIHELGASQGAMWLLGGGRLFRWMDDRVTEISLPDHPTIYDFVATSDRLFLGVPWVVEAVWAEAGLVVSDVLESPATAMTADASGNLWFVSDAELFIKRAHESVRHVLVPEPVQDVRGPGIWIAGTERAFRFEDNQVSAHQVPLEHWVGVDGYGRLLQVDEGALQRHSMGRPVVVTGLSDSLTMQETALLLPSDPGSVTELQAWLNSEPLVVSTDPWSVQIDPGDLENGTHQLRFFCASDLGDTQDEYPVWVGALPEVTWDEIEVLSQTHCMGCHGGATLTNLSTKSDWERLIDPIIHQVTIQSMPQNGPYLTQEEITMIRGWKHGGFQ